MIALFSGIGITGFLLIVLIALLLFGPNKLPELGRAVGRTLKEFKKGANEALSTDDQATRKEVSDEATEVKATQVVDQVQTSGEQKNKLPE